MRKILLVAAVCLLLPRTAFAYPTTVVFTPTGEAMPGGMVGIMAYASTNLAPAVSPGATWVGAEVGLLQQVEYGKGLRFGGLEVGFDTISPNGDGIVKPVLNAKLGLVTEGAFSPAIAAGIMQISPALPSMNFVYVSATKTLQFGGGPSFGRLTLGFADSAGSRSQFNGTFPFRDTRLSLMAAYETPLIAKRLGFVIDHLGGASELSGTWAGASLLLLGTTKVWAGAYFANDRSNPATTFDGFFACLMTSFDARTVFRPRHDNGTTVEPESAMHDGDH